MDAARWWNIEEREATDDELVRAVQAGARERFGELVRRHSRQVESAARRVLGDAPEVEDAMQQAFVRAFVAVRGFAGAASFSTWLTRIAINEARQLARRRRRDRAEPLDPELASAGEASPEREAAAREALALVRRALPRLAPHHREVLVLRHADDLAAAEIGARLGVSELAARLRLYRARRALIAAACSVGHRELRRRGWAQKQWGARSRAAPWRALEVSSGVRSGEGCT